VEPVIILSTSPTAATATWSTQDWLQDSMAAPKADQHNRLDALPAHVHSHRAVHNNAKHRQRIHLELPNTFFVTHAATLLCTCQQILKQPPSHLAAPSQYLAVASCRRFAAQPSTHFSPSPSHPIVSSGTNHPNSTCLR